LALCTLCMHQTMYITEIYLDVQLYSFPPLSQHAIFKFGGYSGN
jgi:hypothetical protein